MARHRMTTWTRFMQIWQPYRTSRNSTRCFLVFGQTYRLWQGWDGFFKNGAEVQAALDEIVVPSNQRSKTVMYALSPSKGQYVPNNGLIRVLGCELGDGKTIGDAYAAGVTAAQKADEDGVGFNASFMMVPGPGSAPVGKIMSTLLRPFGASPITALATTKCLGIRRAIRSVTSGVMSCDSPRLYVSNAIYWR